MQSYLITTGKSLLHHAALAVMLWACCAGRANAQAFERILAPSGNPVVVDTTRSTWVGCAFVDFNNDDKLDLFIADFNGCHLYRNDGSGFTRLSTVAMALDLATYYGTSWADYDNDGDQDCFLAGDVSSLYRNDGSEQFTRVSQIDQFEARGWSPAWADYDEDGDLDILVAHPNGFVGGGPVPNRLLRNEGPPNYQFSRIDTGVVVTGLAPYTSANFSDFDLDGDLDLFIGTGPAVAVGAPDNLYRNMFTETGAAGFTRITTPPIATDTNDGQAWTWIDYDNDRDLDAFVTNWGGGNPALRPNRLYRNDNGTFTRITGQPLVTDADQSLSGVWGDYDNDGDLDVVVANSGSPNSYYQNLGGGAFWRIDDGSAGDLGVRGGNTGASAGDYDNDGDLDLFFTGPLGGPTGNRRGLYLNLNGNLKKWLKLELTGVRSNRSAIGARVWVFANTGSGSIWQQREISTQDCWLGHNSLVVHFGLKNATTIDTLRVVWPSGITWDTTGVAVNQFLHLTEQCPDTDGDGVTCLDNCEFVSNSDQSDTDGDFIGDACDACSNDPLDDIDGDGMCADVDPCPLDPTNDADGDGFCANADNCPSLSNPSQADVDLDGLGDACDLCPGDSLNDIDGDGVCGNLDNCPTLVNALQEDTDSDLIGDSCDNCISVANSNQADADQDGIGDACETCCLGVSGNVDCDLTQGVDISDLSALIDYLYITFTPLCCPQEANCDGQPGVDIADLSALIDYLYISFTPTAVCQ